MRNITTQELTMIAGGAGSIDEFLSIELISQYAGASILTAVGFAISGCEIANSLKYGLIAPLSVVVGSFLGLGAYSKLSSSMMTPAVIEPTVTTVTNTTMAEI